MIKVELIIRSIEKNQDLNYDLFDSENIKNDLKIMSGRAAGICYMPDNYLDEGIHNSEKALLRASFNAKSGHYSVYEHAHLTFMIECPKIVAMVLNSTRLYSTSEKSARYTKMHPETELEVELYAKWLNIFKNEIGNKYEDLTDKEVEKLAMENARYLTSVFTMTTMEFTVPYGRAILLIGWLDDFVDKISKYENDTIFFNRLANECRELASHFRIILGEDKNEPSLIDHKDIGISFFGYPEDYKGTTSYYGDTYNGYYNASFAAIAQLQRHRTIVYKLNPVFDTSYIYIPALLRDTSYENEWISDTFKLFNAGVYTQNIEMLVNESGRFDDFELKAKERLCARAQKEIYDITKLQLYEFEYNLQGLCYSNKVKIVKMLDSSKSFSFRCSFNGYKCKEPCKLVKYGATRLI